MHQTSTENKKALSSLQKPTRLNDISILRVMAMLLVVFYHCLCPYSIWDGGQFFIGFHVPLWDVIAGMLVQIHLPLFFVISGFLFGVKKNGGGYSDIKRFIIDKTQRVMIPYIVVGIFLCLLQRRHFMQMFTGVSHLWFLLTIFECYMAGQFCDKVLSADKKVLRYLLLSSIFIILLMPQHYISIRFLGIDRFVQYFPYYFIGMLFCRIDYSLFKKYITLGLFVLSLVIILFVFQQYFIPQKGHLSVLFGLMVTVLVFLTFRSFTISGLPRSVVSLDKCSMGIYILHHIVIQEMGQFPLFHRLGVDDFYLYPILQFLVVTFMCWSLVAVCKKNRYLQYILG